MIVDVTQPQIETNLGPSGDQRHAACDGSEARSGTHDPEVPSGARGARHGVLSPGAL
jgi:hypothetical protein